MSQAEHDLIWSGVVRQLAAVEPLISLPIGVATGGRS